MKIVKAKYEGYLWMSDQTKPIARNGCEEFELDFEDGENPFIVEARLWDVESKRSISIDCVNGKYYCREIVLDEEFFSQATTTEIYMSNKRIVDNNGTSVSYMKFYRVWKSISDPLCENFETLYPNDLIFAGFTTNKKV